MNIAPDNQALDQGTQTDLVVPLILRGQVIETDLVSHRMRGGSGQFLAPHLAKFADRLPCRAEALQDLYTLSIDDIIDFLADVGATLSLDHNRHLREAFEISLRTSDLPETILESAYDSLPKAFERDKIARFVDLQIGREYLEGWVKSEIGSGRTMSVRAFGARAVHIIAGNTPAVAFMTVLRSALTRSDSIIKLPSNDPMPTVAILRTMVDAAPDHPVTRHLSAAYWKGGDESIEKRLYQPRHIEKIVAWGGYASVTHVTKYLQPGIDLITLDPKHSGSIVGPEAFASVETMVEVAARAAMDIGAFNQEACANARVIYVVRDQDDPQQMAQLQELGERIMAGLLNLPEEVSTPAKSVNAQLQDELAGIELQDDFFKLVRRGKDNEGAVIVSQFDEAVEFSELLCNRTANLVPVRNVEEALRRINAASQTIGVYPDTLKEQIRDRLAIQGAQHIVSLGEVMLMGTYGPQDGLETERRMLRWIRDVNGEPVPENLKFTVESEPATVGHYRRDWLPHQYRDKPVGMAGMWLAGLVSDAEGGTYLAIRGVDDMAPGMVHAVVPIVGFRKLDKGDMSGEPPHLFAEWGTADEIDWYEPYEAIETIGRTVMSYPTGRIERDRHGCHWFDANNRWELHGETMSEVFTVHVPEQDRVEGNLCYRHELLKATGQVNGVPVEGYIHQDYSYAPKGKVWTETAIPRLIQSLWVSWVHQFDDGEMGGGCFWQGRKGLAFGPGYQVRNGVTTVHDDIVANLSFDDDNHMKAIDVTIGGNSYRFETESKSSRMHYIARLADSSLGRKPVKSWCWIEYSGSFMTGDSLDEALKPFAIVRGR